MIKINVKQFLIYLFLFLACLTNYFFEDELLSYIIFLPSILLALHQSFTKPVYIIGVILFLSSNAMGLLPSLPVLNGTFKPGDLLIFYIFFVFIISIKYKLKFKFDFIGIVIIVFYLFRIIGALRGKMIYNQDFFTGMLTLRETYVYILYFPIISFMRKGTFSKSQLLNEIYKFIKVISVIYLVQLALLYVGIDITNYQYDIRWGYRLRASNIFQIFGILYILYKLLTKQHNKNDIIWLIIFAAEMIFINQSRIVILGAILTIATIIILNPNTKRKFAIIFLGIILSSALLLNNRVRQVIIESVSESQSNNNGSMLYRKYEKEYFDNKLSAHKLLGVGTPNMHKGEAANYSGMLKVIVYKGYYMNGFYTSDLGVYAIKYYWGIVGLTLFWIFSIIYLIKFLSVYFKKKYNVYIFLSLSMLIFNMIISYTLCFFITQPIIYFLIFILGSKINDSKELPS